MPPDICKLKAHLFAYSIVPKPFYTHPPPKKKKNQTKKKPNKKQ